MKLILFVYNIFIVLLMPFIALIGYVIMKNKGKADFWFEHFGFIRKAKINKNKCIWFHCASVGEVRSIKNIVEILREKYSDLGVIVSTMTATGKKEAINYLNADFSFLIPIENSQVVVSIISNYNVSAVVIVDTEIWPNFIYSVSSRTKLFLINGRISDKTFKIYKRFSFFFGPILNRFSAILTKSQEDEERFSAISKNRKKIITAGNIKFQQRKKREDVTLIEELKNKNFLLMASTHNGEEKIFLDYITDSLKSFEKIVICPRHIERSYDIRILCETYNLSCGFYSENDFNKDVIIIDTFGKLEGLYIIANKIFIGGSILDIGGHNIYEALQFERNIAVGPYMHSFKEIYEIANKYNLVTTINSKDDCINWINSQEISNKDDFNKFFEEIDNINKDTVNTVVETISTVIDVKVK